MEDLRVVKPIPTVMPLVVDPIVQRNLDRWRAEQDAKKQKRDKKFGEIESALKARFNREPKLYEVKQELRKAAEASHKLYLLRTCRATIAESLAAKEEGK